PVLSGLLAPCSGWPTRIPGRDGGVWGLSGVLHLFHGPCHFVLYLLRCPRHCVLLLLCGTLRCFLHLPHRLIPLPLALEVVVIRERTHRLFDTPFDLVGLAPHGRSPCVSCVDCACGHHRWLCGAMP